MDMSRCDFISFSIVTPAAATIPVLMIVKRAAYTGKSAKEDEDERASWIEATESHIRTIAAQWTPESLDDSPRQHVPFLHNQYGEYSNDHRLERAKDLDRHGCVNKGKNNIVHVVSNSIQKSRN